MISCAQIYTPDRKGILVAVFLADMLNTIFREILSTIEDHNPDIPQNTTGKAHLGLFIAVAIVIIAISAIVSLWVISTCDTDTKAIKTLLLAVQLVGAVLYYYGDNITYIADHYGEALGWSQRNIDNNKKAANITLGLALVFQHFLIPLLIEAAGLCIEGNMKSNKNMSHSSMNMITTFLPLDAFFTLATRTWQTEPCDKIGSWIFVSLITLSLLIVYSFLSCRTRYSCCGVLVLAISLPVYLVADNPLPLDCTSGHSILRLCFSIGTFLVVLIAAIPALYCHCTRTPTSKSVKQENNDDYHDESSL